jgi:predicted RNA binding protein YcfA (HicA-like mRNA interferase family)/predicted RNase H-like HicB family nuclease
MPRKIRQLVADLKKHGFVDRGGKGSHRNFLHPLGVRVTLSGGRRRRLQALSRTGYQARYRKNSDMSKTSDRYVKVVAWSEEDQCYVGRCPGLMLGGVHGSDERDVYAELCDAVDEWIKLHEGEGRPLPRSTSLREIEAMVTELDGQAQICERN